MSTANKREGRSYAARCKYAYEEVMYAYKAVMALRHARSTQNYRPGGAPRGPSAEEAMFKMVDFATDVENALSAALADKLSPEEWEALKFGGDQSAEARRKVGVIFIVRELFPVKSYMKRSK